jgi:sugar-specific transcriptional regulator TrmB
MESQLLTAFTFDPIHYALTNLKKLILELELVEISQDWMNQLKGKVQTLRDVTSRFGVEIQNHLKDNPAIEENEKLQQRIVEASRYFSKGLNELTGIFVDHPFKTNNRSVSKKLDKYLKQAADIMKEASAKIDCCETGFRMIEFLKWKKRFTEIALSPRSCYSDQLRKKEETANLELSERLKEFRNQLADSENTPVYMIFSNTAIRNCCEMLPGDTDSLLEVSGFGKKKVEQFGKEIIEIVLEYCKEKDLIPKIIAKDEKKNKELFRKASSLSPTVLETIELFRSGKNVDEIVAARKLVSSTIEGHLAVGIRNNIVDIHHILKQEEIDEMKMLFDLSSGHLELALAREKSNSKFSYGKLKMVQSWLVSQLA